VVQHKRLARVTPAPERRNEQLEIVVGAVTHEDRDAFVSAAPAKSRRLRGRALVAPNLLRTCACMTDWLTAGIVALAVLGLSLGAVGLIAYIRLVDPFRVDAASWIGDLTQGVIVLVATLAFLALGFASREPYAYLAAASTAGLEAVGIWLLWLIRRVRAAPAHTTGSAKPRPLASAEGSRAPGSAAVGK
jgi:hypothetical protein